MSSFGSADFPVQHPVAEPTSDDELQLIFEVESLQTQLSEAGRPVDEKIAHIFIQSVAPKFSVPFSVELIRLGAVAPTISGRNSSRGLPSRKDHDLLFLTSKYPLC